MHNTTAVLMEFPEHLTLEQVEKLVEKIQQRLRTVSGIELVEKPQIESIHPEDSACIYCP